jgi:hypothetical protein
MERDSFPPGVADQLKWYVYRLIDPRNGDTFYVGKGRGDRIFQHAKGALSATNEEDAADLKSQRIKDVNAAGLDVAHVIHRHHIENQSLAFQIEAALIDAYPGLTNKVSGHGAGDYGCRHVEEIVSEYASQPFEVSEPLILISISKSYEEEGRTIYDAVRYAWKVNVNRAKKLNLVLAHRQGLVIGAFRPRVWLETTIANFPGLVSDIPGRWGFEGEPAEENTQNLYKGKRVPDQYRAKGAANPIRFINPERPARHITN